MLRSAFSAGRGRLGRGPRDPNNGIERKLHRSLGSGQRRNDNELYHGRGIIAKLFIEPPRRLPNASLFAGNRRLWNLSTTFSSLSSTYGNARPSLQPVAKEVSLKWVPVPVPSVYNPIILPRLDFRGSSLGNRIPTLRFSALSSPTVMRPPQYQAIRFFSSDGTGGQGKDKGVAKEGAPETTKGTEKEADAKDAEGENAEKMDPRAFLLGTRESLRKVTEWQVGDMMATYSIVLLLGIILISPVAVRYMRGSESTYDELDTDDQVVDLTRIIRRDYLDKVSEDGSSEDKGVVDSVLADVLSSKALQAQAIKFVVSIAQSEEVKTVLQGLLKDLWNDLVKDPETTAQVIFLLNIAIQNEDIRLAVKKLVLEMVEDEEVLEELVRLLQKLGQDQEVLDATKTLLSESAHNALNDPEVLDHSMEFATDVVGDDVVQRTAGEALRNTFSYAVKPGVTVLLALTGVGLLFFSVVSLGYATRSSEKEAAVFYEAVSGLGDRVWSIVALPFQAAASAASAFFTTVLLPYHFVQRVVARIEYTGSAASRALHIATVWTTGNVRASIDWIIGTCGAISSSVTICGNAVGGAVVGSTSWLSKSSTRVVSSLMRTGKSLTAWATSALIAVASFFGGVGSSAEVTGQNMSRWFANAAVYLRRQTYPRVWVVLDAVSNFLLSCKNVFA